MNYEKSSEAEIVQFVENLLEIKKFCQTDFILFSFVTTDNFEIVKKMENQLKNYCKDSNILIGHHLCSDENRIVSKPCDIINLIEQLNSVYDVDDKIYYADDCQLYHYILDELISEFKYPYDIHSIIPINSGLSDVNKNLIESFETIEKNDINIFFCIIHLEGL